MKPNIRGPSRSVAIILVTLASSALLLARGTTELVAARLLPRSDARRSSVAAAPQAAPGSVPADICEILERNAFDPTTGALCPPKPTERPRRSGGGGGRRTVADLSPGQLPPACEGHVKLIAAVYSTRSPQRSFAALSVGSADARLYRLDGAVEGKEVAEIFPRAVYLRDPSGRRCSLTMFAQPREATAVVARVDSSRSNIVKGSDGRVSAAGALSDADLRAGIARVSETEFNVQRALVDKVLDNQEAIMGWARVIPHAQAGQVVGVKLYGIRTGSPLGQLGLQNGDLLRTINGYDLSSPDSALEAYGHLRSEDNLSLAVTRHGHPLTLDYDIR